MQVYSTKKLATFLALSVLVALAVSYGIVQLAVPHQPSKSPGISISKSPTLLNISPGSSGTYSVRLNSQNGFSGLLKLAAHVPNSPSSLAVSVSPQQVSIPSGGSVNASLTVSTNPVTPAGSYSIVLNATGQSVSGTETVPINVVGFTVSSNPTSLTFPTTSTGRSVITVSSENGFTGNVNLFASSSASGPIIGISPNTLFVPANGNTTSTLTVQSSAQGRFDVTVTVTGNQFYQSVTLPVTATSISNSGDFNITTIPQSFSINPGNFRNVVVKLDSLNGCDCLVTISVSGVSEFAYGIGPYIVEVPPGGSANSTLTLSAAPTAAPGTYNLSVIGTSLTATHSTQLQATITTQPVADMNVTANLMFLQVKQGSSNSTLINIKSIAGFSGTVTLTASYIPSGASGVSLSLNPTSVFLASNGVAASNLTITAASGAQPMGFNFTVTATSGTLSRGVYGNFQVVAPGGFVAPGGLVSLSMRPASSSESCATCALSLVSQDSGLLLLGTFLGLATTIVMLRISFSEIGRRSWLTYGSHPETGHSRLKLRKS